MTNKVNLSGAAGSSLAAVGTYVLHGKFDWLTLRVTTSGAALTNFAFDACHSQTQLAAGSWWPALSSTDWADATKFHDGEESGTDDQGNGHYVYNLGDGEFTQIRLCVTGLHAFRLRALGSGATVTSVGHVTQGE